MTKLTHDKIAAGLNEALATAPPRLTKSQRKILRQLPANGSWADFGTAAPWMVLGVLIARHLVTMKSRDAFSKEAEQFRLTPAGMAAREELEKRGDMS
jgi:hypothetical protein